MASRGEAFGGIRFRVFHENSVQERIAQRLSALVRIGPNEQFAVGMALATAGGFLLGRDEVFAESPVIRALGWAGALIAEVLAQVLSVLEAVVAGHGFEWDAEPFATQIGTAFFTAAVALAASMFVSRRLRYSSLVMLAAALGAAAVLRMLIVSG